MREFRVIALPGAEARPAEGRSGSNERAKHGPLLSARGLDLDLLWRRANQLCKVSSQVGGFGWCVGWLYWLPPGLLVLGWKE